jgi:acyl-CoA synthetase (AMP-forming)/AMP-acid ligase II
MTVSVPAASAILTRFAEICRDDPRRPMIHVPATASAWTAADIWDAHRRCADRLTRVAVGPGHLVLSAAGNSPASVALLLACRAVDLPIMPIDAGTPLPELLALADRFAAAAIVVPATLDAEPRQARDPAVELDPGLLLRPHSRLPRCYPGAAMLKVTSGSTGPAQATVTTEAQLVADGAHIAAAMRIEPGDTQIAAIPLSHSYGLGVVVMPLLMQGTACVLRDSFVPHQLPADARQFGARVFPGVPFMFEYFLAHPPAGGWPPTLQRLMSAGAPLTPATVRAFHERYGVKIHSFYGTTETGGIAFDDSDDIDDSGTVGRALPGVTLTLLAGAQAGRRRQSGMERIHVRSAAVTDGYSDGTCDGFVEGGFLTGDYGAWDEQRRLKLLGRASSFVNVAGRKVQPDEVERVLREMPGVRDVRVLAAPDQRRGQQIVACIVADAAQRLSVLAVRRFCSARLASYKIPRTIVFLDALPLTARGKVDRTALDNLVRHRLLP